MREIKAKIWMIRKYGIKRYLRYQKLRREGIEIDYSKIFSPNEFTLLEEHDLWPIK